MVTRSPGASENALDDLFRSLARNRSAALRAVGHADRCVEKAKVVVDFGDGADSGSRAAAGGFLLDGDGGAEAFDGIDIGPLDLVEKLASVGGKSLHVAALAFGIDGVEGERGLARAGETGDHGKRVARNLER